MDEKNILTIGILDDEPLIRDYLADTVMSMGSEYQLAGAEDSAEKALFAWRKNRPGLILTDIMMSGMNGLEFIERIRKENWDTEIIVLSGHDDFHYAQTAIAAGVFRYILKPVDENELKDLLAEVRQKRSKQGGKTFRKACEASKGKMFAAVIKPGTEGGANCGRLLERLSEGEYGWVEGNALLVLLKQSVLEPPLERVERLLKAYNENSKAYIAGIGRSGIGPEELDESREQAYDAVEGVFFGECSGVAEYSKHDTVVIPDDTKKMMTYREIASEITGCMITGNRKGIKECVCRNFLLHDRSNRFRVRESFYSECGMLYLLIGLLLEEEGFDEILDPLEVFLQKLQLLPNYRACIEYLSDSLLEACNSISDAMDGSDNGIIVRIKHFLVKNYERDVKLKELSENFYLSPSYLSTYFKKETGSTISDYVIMLRIQEAKRMLQKSYLTVEEIANAVGYTNARYFSTLFKKITGLSPVQYRLSGLRDKRGNDEL